MRDIVKTLVVMFLANDFLACFAKVTIYNRAIVGKGQNLDATENEGSMSYSDRNQKQRHDKSSDFDETDGHGQKRPGGESDEIIITETDGYGQKLPGGESD